MPSNNMPNNFLISTIHIPARGSTLMECEKVPISNKGTPKPRPKKKRSIKPINLLPKVVTMLNNSTKPGDKHGDATEPLTAPKKNAEMKDPCLKLDLLDCNERGIYIS